MKYLFAAAAFLVSQPAHGAELKVPPVVPPPVVVTAPPVALPPVALPPVALPPVVVTAPGSRTDTGRHEEFFVPCWVVRSYVWMKGEKIVVDWAVKNGYTSSQIATVRARCIAR